MPGALEALRTRRGEVHGEMETLSGAASPTDEQRARFRELDTEITQLDSDIELHERQAEREQRAAAARAAASGGTTTDHSAATAGTQGSGWQVGDEPTTYGRDSGHSYFMDLARQALRRGDGDGGVRASEDRLNRHANELSVEMPKRREARARAARTAVENALVSGNRQQRRAAERALTRMERLGVTMYETRAMNRVDGTGGYLIPPLWLVDDVIGFLRAGREFANLWHNMPLPSGTDSINIPRISQGSATGPQAADGATVNGRDMQDAFVNAKVMTISGQMDVALQLLDQSPIAGFDEFILRDLQADYDLNFGGQAYLGSGSAGQLNGVWPSGTISTSTGIYVNNTNNATGQTWVNGGSSSVVGSVHQSAGQLLALVSRTRLRPPTHWVWPPSLWYYLTTQTDNQLRPLVVPGTPSNIGYNQVAVDTDGPVVTGPVGYYMGLPIVLDPNIPMTFGGATAPSMGTISAGQFAPNPGNGSYAPMLAIVADDLFLWEGEMRTRALDQVLSGNLQMRFQLYNYAASMPNRYQAYSNITTGSGPTTVGVGPSGSNPGTSLSYATLTQYTANGVLNPIGQGF